MTTQTDAEVLLIDGAPRPDRSWWITSFHPGDRVRMDTLGSALFTVTHSARDDEDPRLWRLELTAEGEPPLTMRLPPHTRAVGEGMVRTLTAKCLFSGCGNTGEVTAEVGSLGSPRIKKYICADH
ncbi:hypothetical protein [Streptomyces anulatus]|uniref:hypothetical protein n=1 Tax=Streptomyces anulatus TaxID=1892 RepID=UPI001C27CBF9|nr:hypothetical protein [Streptomyces anulatus]